MENREFLSHLRDVIEEMLTPMPVDIGKRWEDGTLILKPGVESQAKEIPLEIFFKKIIGLRESLRVLEQKINNHPALPSEDKLSLQSYITRCYGSLTTFNILFKDDKDKFVGSSSGEDKPSDLKKEKLTLAAAKKRLGLNEYGED